MFWKKVFYLEYLFACYFYKYSVQVLFIKRKSNLKDSINHETNLHVFGQKFLPKIKLNNFFGLPLVVLTTVSLRRSFSFSRHRLKYG